MNVCVCVCEHVCARHGKTYLGLVWKGVHHQGCGRVERKHQRKGSRVCLGATDQDRAEHQRGQVHRAEQGVGLGQRGVLRASRCM